MLSDFKSERTMDVRNLLVQANSENNPATINSAVPIRFKVNPWSPVNLPIYEACYGFAEGMIWLDTSH